MASLPLSETSPRRPSWPRLTGLVSVTVLTLLVALTYWPVVGYDFVRWDDDINITQNPLLTAPWSSQLLVRMLASDQALRFEPVHWLLVRLLHDAFGLNPAAWHALNLVLHGASACLLLVVLRRILEIIAPEATELRRELAALGGAALWALHPLRAEVVGWATASTYSLTAVFLLGSFLWYLRAAVQPANPRWALLWSWLFAAAAYGSYPVGATYALWLVGVDRWLLARHRGALNREFAVDVGRSLRRALIFVAPAAVAVLLTVWARMTTPGIFSRAPSLASVGVPVRTFMVLADLPYFAWRLVWPVDLTPSIPPMVIDGEAMLLLCGVAVVAVAILAQVWQYRQEVPGLALVVLGGGAIALPCLGWTEWPTWPVDRYSYIVDLVLCGGLAGFLLLALQRVRPLAGWCTGLAAALLISGLGFASRAQVRIWRDSSALFGAITHHPGFLAHAGQATHVYLLWARYELGRGNQQQAAELIKTARQIGFPAMRLAAMTGEYHRALALNAELEHFYTLTPLMRRDKADWLLHISRPDEAMAELREVEKALPNDSRTRELLREAERQNAESASSHP